MYTIDEDSSFHFVCRIAKIIRPTWAWAVDEVALLSVIGVPRSDGCAT